MNPDRSAPLPNEFELSIFGSGVGESIVVHLGDGKWIIVDSLPDRSTGNPAALEYLSNTLGLDCSRCISSVILTHWHNDHTRGASKILQSCPDATVIASAALKTTEFKTLVFASDIEKDMGTDEFCKVLEVLKARNSGSRLEAVGPHWAIANTAIVQTPQARVTALSPSSATLTLAFHEIAQSIQHNSARRRAVSQEPNELAIALWIEAGAVRVLLGADLESGGGDEVGWKGIVNSALRPHGKAILFKIPHHGSENAHEPRVWAEMVEADPLCVLTPYTAGKKPLPSPGDVERLRNNAKRSFITHPPKGPKLSGISTTVEKVVKLVSQDMRDIDGKLGQVRIRMPLAGGEPTVRLFGSAMQL